MSAEFDGVWRALEQKGDSGWAPGMVAGIRHRGTAEYFATGVRAHGQSAPIPTGIPFGVASLGEPVAGALAVSMIADSTPALDDPDDDYAYFWEPVAEALDSAAGAGRQQD